MADSYVSSRGITASLFEQVVGEHRFQVAYENGMDEVPIQRVVVPRDRYFFLGDFRNNSKDSRFWGTVHRDDLIGPVTMIYWSVPPSTYTPRWSRIGKRVQ